MMRNIVLLFLVGVFCLGCGGVENVVESGSFFDLKEYIAGEKERLIKDKIKLKKTITLNGVEEIKIIETPDYEIEFSEFLSSDINRVAWLDKYDEIKVEDEIHYVAKGNKLEVKEMNILGGEQISQISIYKKTENMLNNTTKELIYSPSGYQIKSVRKSIGESADTLVIAVKFLD
ncbi:MAG: hypothetical protein ACI94Y_000667 [Maribacter sp.]|jgi:hypothetical protein